MNPAERLWKPGERQRIARESLDFFFPGKSFPVKIENPQATDPGKYTYLPDIAVKLQKYPANAQQDYWTDCLWRLQIPNSDNLAQVISQISSIKWAVPQKDANEQNLTTLVHEYLSRLNIPLIPIAIQSDSEITQAFYHSNPDHGACMATRPVAKSSNRVEETRIIREISRNLTFDSITKSIHPTERGRFWNWEIDAVSAFTNGSMWTLLEDQKELFTKQGFNKGNPFIPLMEIYKLGCIPLGLENTAYTKRRYAIFIPDNQSYTTQPQS